MNNYIEQENICKKTLKKVNIEHSLNQIGHYGNYYLDDLKFVEYIPLNEVTPEEYYEKLDEYDIGYIGNEYTFDNSCIIECNNSLGEYFYDVNNYSVWDEFGLSNLRKSKISSNCGWELISEESNRDHHVWLQEILEKNSLSEMEVYKISVDNITSPNEIYIYDEDSNILLTLDYHTGNSI